MSLAGSRNTVKKNPELCTFWGESVFHGIPVLDIEYLTVLKEGNV